MDINYYKQYEPIFGSWYITRLIGEGSFGKVFEIEREDFGVTYKAALKAITIPASQSEARSMMDDGTDATEVHGYFEGCVRELVEKIALVYKLRGSNVVSYEDHQVIKHKDGVGWDILIQMELLTPLNSYIQEKKAMPRQEIIKLGIDLCKALELCQKFNIIHRDIKPENIFISEHGDFKLGDFDIAQALEGTAGAFSSKGTYSYMAPEVYKGEACGFTADIYSLGLVLYRLLNGNRLPFLPTEPAPITYANREQALQKRLSGAPLPMPSHADRRLWEIVLKACAYDPRDRYADPAQMRQALEQVDDCSLAPPEAVLSGHAWPREWRTSEICSFALCQGETEFTCDGDQVTMKLNLKREDGQPFAPSVVRLTPAQRDALWKQLERISREGWAMTNEQAALLGAFDYEWSKCFQCELTGGRQFQYCSNGDVPPGFTALYEFLRDLAFPHGRCPEDAHAFVPAIMRGGWNSRPEEYLYCEKCGLAIPLLGAELYPGSKLQGVSYAWPAAWRAEDILRFSVSFGDRPIRHFTYDGGILTAVNRIDVSRDGGSSFPRGYFDPVSIALPDGQSAAARLSGGDPAGAVEQRRHRAAIRPPVSHRIYEAFFFLMRTERRREI